MAFSHLESIERTFVPQCNLLRVLDMNAFDANLIEKCRNNNTFKNQSKYTLRFDGNNLTQCKSNSFFVVVYLSDSTRCSQFRGKYTFATGVSAVAHLFYDHHI